MDVVIHIIGVGPKIIAWLAGMNVSVGQRIMTTNGDAHECIAAGTTGAVEPTSKLDAFVDGTVTWRYLCTQDYNGLTELSADYAAGVLPLDLPGALENHKIYIWDNGATYSGWNSVNWLSTHTALYHTEFSVPGPNNIPIDFVGTWDLAIGDSAVEQLAGVALSSDVAKGAMIAHFRHHYRAYHRVLERIQCVNGNSGGQVLVWGIGSIILRDCIFESTAVTRGTASYNAAFIGIGVGTENCIFIDRCRTAGATVIDGGRTGSKNCHIIHPSNSTPDPTMVFWSGVRNPGFLNVTVMGWGNNPNPFPDQPATPSGWTFDGFVTDMAIAVVRDATITNYKFSSTYNDTTPFMSASTVGGLDLRPASTATDLIDKGSPGGPGTDFFGVTRIIPDVGAVEYVAPPAPVGGAVNVLVRPLTKSQVWPLVLALPSKLNEDND